MMRRLYPVRAELDAASLSLEKGLEEDEITEQTRAHFGLIIV